MIPSSYIIAGSGGLDVEDAAIAAGVRAYVTVLQAALDAHCDACGWKRATVLVSLGRKFLKVLTQNGYGHQGPSAYSFIEKATGRVLYAASFKKPDLKNPRGSVLDGTWLEWHGPHGAGYVAEHRAGQVAARFIPMDAADYMVVRDAIMAGNGAAAVDLVERRIREAAELRKAAKTATSTCPCEGDYCTNPNCDAPECGAPDTPVL